MINTLAPLGATHNIVLILAYEVAATGLAGVDITVTAHLKPKDGVKCEARSLQFKGPIAEVEREIAEKLPGAVAAIASHTVSLADLEKELASEKEKAAAENKKQIDEAKKSTPTPKAAAKAPAKPTVKPAPASKLGAKKPAAAGSAAAALAKLEQTAKGELPLETNPAAELEKLAGMMPAPETVEL